MPNRRVTLIENPPEIWIQDGLFYCNFNVTDGSVIAFRPSAWFATAAVGRRVTEEWKTSGGNIVPFGHELDDGDEPIAETGSK